MDLYTSCVSPKKEALPQQRQCLNLLEQIQKTGPEGKTRAPQSRTKHFALPFPV